MKIRTTATHYIADARQLAGGEKKYPKTPEGKREAQAYLRRVQAEHHQRGAFVDPSRTPHFEAATAEYLAFERQRAVRGELSAAHVENKRIALADLGAIKIDNKPLAATRLGDLTPGAIKREIVPALFGSCAHATARKKFQILRHFLQWAVETSEVLRSNPALVKLPPKPQHEDRPVDRISTEAVLSIIAHASPHYRLAIKFAAFTGLRAGEQLALSWDDVDLEAGLVRVTRAVKKGGEIGEPKTRNARRTVPLEPSLLADLRAWKLAQPVGMRRRNLVFASGGGAVNSIDNLRNRGLTPACKAAGVEVLRWHDLRHHFASVLLFQLNESDTVVTALMGHHSIAFTQAQYGHWLPEARRDVEIANRLGAAFRR